MFRSRVLNEAVAGPGAVVDDPVGLSAAMLRDRLSGRAAPGQAELRGVDPVALDNGAARKAFWINVYNALLLSIDAMRPFRRSVLLSLPVFRSYAFDVGGHEYTLDLIENGILRGNRRPPVGLRPMLRGTDPRLGAVLSPPDPRIHFALNCGARSCPPIHVYDEETVEDRLEAATRSYLEAETVVRVDEGAVRLPGLIRLYGADFGDRDARLRFAAARLPDLARLLEHHREPDVSYSRFDWGVAIARRPA